MKFKLLAVALVGCWLGVSAQSFTEWKDPNVNAVNRAPMRAQPFAYKTGEKAAKCGCLKHSSNYLSLNGKWKFNWVNDADQRPVDFWSKSFNDKGWGTMPVPGMWELNGYGDPQYVNTGYPLAQRFREQSAAGSRQEQQCRHLPPRVQGARRLEGQGYIRAFRLGDLLRLPVGQR